MGHQLLRLAEEFRIDDEVRGRGVFLKLLRAAGAHDR